MNSYTKLLASVFILSAHAASATILTGVSFLSPRSQSTNAARELVGWYRDINLFDMPGWYGATDVTLEYGQSFRPKRLAEYFFSRDELNITGSQSVNRTDADLLADYFGLSPTFFDTVLLRPIYKAALADIAAYVGYKNWFFRAHAPLTWVKTRIKLFEDVEDDGSETLFPAGYMATDAVAAPYTSFAQAMDGTQSFGDVQALKFGKISTCGRDIVRLSDLQAALGYLLVNRENGYVGLMARVAAPTGNRSKATYLFEPMVGNGKHWELGLGLDGKIMVWEKDGIQQTDFLVVFNMSHLFTSRQRRSFDLTPNGFGSRYILLKQFDENGIYTGTTLPAINLTTLNCKVRVDFQLDAAFAFGYTYDNRFGFDIGYNVWLRSHEKVCLCEADPFANANYGVKGIQNVVNPDLSTDTTQSTAELDGNIFDDQALVADADSPVFIRPGSLNMRSASAPLAVTHKIFWNWSYHWPRPDRHVTPFICSGGEVEFEGVRPKDVQPNKPAMAQWGFWVKGGCGWE